MDLLDYLDLWLSLRTRIKVWTSADRLHGCFGGNADDDNRTCDGDVRTATESASGDAVTQSVFLCFWRGDGRRGLGWRWRASGAAHRRKVTVLDWLFF
jgi:hypothetical protein